MDYSEPSEIGYVCMLDGYLGAEPSTHTLPEFDRDLYLNDIRHLLSKSPKFEGLNQLYDEIIKSDISNESKQMANNFFSLELPKSVFSITHTPKDDPNRDFKSSSPYTQHGEPQHTPSTKPSSYTFLRPSHTYSSLSNAIKHNISLKREESMMIYPTKNVIPTKIHFPPYDGTTFEESIPSNLTISDIIRIIINKYRTKANLPDLPLTYFELRLIEEDEGTPDYDIMALDPNRQFAKYNVQEVALCIIEKEVNKLSTKNSNISSFPQPFDFNSKFDDESLRDFLGVQNDNQSDEEDIYYNSFDFERTESFKIDPKIEPTQTPNHLNSQTFFNFPQKPPISINLTNSLQNFDKFQSQKNLNRCLSAHVPSIQERVFTVMTPEHAINFYEPTKNYKTNKIGPNVAKSIVVVAISENSHIFDLCATVAKLMRATSYHNLAFETLPGKFSLEMSATIKSIPQDENNLIIYQLPKSVYQPEENLISSQNKRTPLSMFIYSPYTASKVTEYQIEFLIISNNNTHTANDYQTATLTIDGERIYHNFTHPIEIQSNLLKSKSNTKTSSHHRLKNLLQRMTRPLTSSFSSNNLTIFDNFPPKKLHISHILNIKLHTQNPCDFFITYPHHQDSPTYSEGVTVQYRTKTPYTCSEIVSKLKYLIAFHFYPGNSDL